MQINPRYGDDPIIVLEGEPDAIGVPALRQWRRLADALTGLSDDQWDEPSRCDGWSCRDVVVHLDSVNTFWRFSVEAGLRRDPSRFLASFDPVATPAAIVAGVSDRSAGEVLEGFLRSTGALVELIESLGAGDWPLPAEAPPGHISISALAHHALWDSWVHERDIFVPLGVQPPREADEIAAALAYVAALAPGFGISEGAAHSGVLVIEATDPDTALTVEIDGHVTVRRGAADSPDLVLDGDAVTLLEALSIRRPLPQGIPDSQGWMVGGLAAVFDVAS